MSPMERKAEFAREATLRGKSRNRAAKEDLDVSLAHIQGVLDGSRPGSEDLRRRFADYVGKPYQEIWGEPDPAADASGRAAAAV